MCENSRPLANRRGVMGGIGQREVGVLRTASANRGKMEGGILNRYMIRDIAGTVGISLR